MATLVGKSSTYAIHVQMLVFKEGLRDSQARCGFRNETVVTENIFIKEPSFIILLSIQNCPNIYQILLKKVILICVNI